ncbi:MAG: GAF domain-containing protein, partial [Myxococcales bacterium]|nr:GAF domain-containing protein [Myxococcales bacterium]
MPRQDELRALFDAMNEGVAGHELVRDASGRVHDYRVLAVNPAFTRHTGLSASAVVGRLASAAFGSSEPPFLSTYQRVAETGVPETFEAYFEPLRRHFRISAFQTGPDAFGTVSRPRLGRQAPGSTRPGCKRCTTLARLRTADEKELIDFALESAVALTGSEVGYLHFVDDDQQNLTLYTWSERTLQNCSVGTERHYPLSLAGIWADCVRLRRPVIHNDYATAEGKKGLPEGHFPLVRHLSTCVVERDKVTVVAGVGNKPTPYQDDDVRQLQLFLDGVWD